MPQQVEIRDARETDIAGIVSDLHPIDETERKLIGLNAEDSLRHGIAWSAICRIALIEGKPLAIFGVVPTGERQGISWMYTTRLVDQHRRAFVRRSIDVLAQIREQYDYLHNMVPESNAPLIGWLRMLGFQISEHYDLNGVGFVHYEWKRHV